MNENENKYLSLKTAAELYGYTRDHLGLMIRQGKLKGIKLGSYYVTTKDWMIDYLKDYADPGHPAAAGKFSNKFLIQAFAAKEKLVSSDNSVKTEDEAIRINAENKSGVKSKIVRKNIGSKPTDKFFSEIQKELLSSLKELSTPQKEISAPYSQSALHNNSLSGSYVILPIRKMEKSEREDILGKISDRDKPKDGWETTGAAKT